MADLTATIETMEHRWMRAWVNGDMRALKSVTAKNFILLTGSKPPAILDRPSWLEAAANRHLASSYRFADIYVRGFGGIALFSATLELKATMDGRDWSGRLFVTDLWRKRRIGGWKMVQRVVSKPDEDPQVAKAIKSLQLWKWAAERSDAGAKRRRSSAKRRRVAADGSQSEPDRRHVGFTPRDASRPNFPLSYSAPPVI